MRQSQAIISRVFKQRFAAASSPNGLEKLFLAIGC